MQDRLEEFLITLANNVGPNKFRAYNPDPADAELNSFAADINRLYRLAGDDLLYTGQTHGSSYATRCPIGSIQVMLTKSGVALWRATLKRRAEAMILTPHSYNSRASTPYTAPTRSAITRFSIAG